MGKEKRNKTGEKESAKVSLDSLRIATIFFTDERIVLRLRYLPDLSKMNSKQVVSPSLPPFTLSFCWSG